MLSHFTQGSPQIPLAHWGLISYFVSIWGCPCHWHMHRWGTTCRSWWSSSITVVSGNELRLSSLAASTITHWAILPAQIRSSLSNFFYNGKHPQLQFSTLLILLILHHLSPQHLLPPRILHTFFFNCLFFHLKTQAPVTVRPFFLSIPSCTPAAQNSA